MAFRYIVPNGSNYKNEIFFPFPKYLCDSLKSVITIDILYYLPLYCYGYHYSCQITLYKEKRCVQRRWGKRCLQISMKVTQNRTEQHFI